MTTLIKITITLLFIPSFIYSQWHSIDLGTKNELNDIYFLDDTLGFCIGDGSIFYVTSNGGKVWEYKKLDNEKHQLNRIKFIDEIGFILGNGIIYRTTDRGLNWDSVYADSSITFVDLDFYPPNKIWLRCSVVNSEYRGLLFESNDAGITWHKLVDTDEVPKLKGMHAVKLMGEETALVLCSASIDPLGPTAIYKTTNNGIDWDYYSENLHYTWGLTGNNNDTLWAWGTSLEFSVDSGKTWKSDSIQVIKNDGSIEYLDLWAIPGLRIVNNSQVVFLGAKSNGYFIYLKRNDSWLFEEIEIPSSARLTSMYYINKDNIWCVGIGGTLITNNIFTDIKRDDNFSESNNFEILGNYPNPFNPTTTINYTLPEDGKVQVKIFDVLGRELATLINGIESKGKHSVSWDGSNVSSGIYFYAITFRNQTINKKMLLIK